MTAPTPPECDPERVETVARALAPVWVAIGLSEATPMDDLRRLAAAAIAADPSPAEEAVKRVDAVARAMRQDGVDSYAGDPDDAGRARAVALYYAADQLFAALASPAPAPQTVTIDVADARAGEPEDYRAVPVDAPEVLTGDAGRAAYPPAPAPQGGAR